jgi:hypothetical protein
VLNDDENCVNPLFLGERAKVGISEQADETISPLVGEWH